MQKQQLILKNLDSFLLQFRPEEQGIFHLAIVAQKYFYMAEIQLNALTDALAKTFNEQEKGTAVSIYSYTAGVYALLRTSLEASRRLADYFNETSQSAELLNFRKINKQEICDEIIDIANDLVKHPIDSMTSEFFCEPGGYDSVGKIDFYRYSSVDKDYFEVLSVYPGRALVKMFNYLEGLSEIYNKILPSLSIKNVTAARGLMGRPAAATHLAIPGMTEGIREIEIKCAHCFNEMAIKDPEREHFAFCTDSCRMKGRFFPTKEKMRADLVRRQWRKNNREKSRAIALKSYHKNKKLTGRPRGRPRKIVDEAIDLPERKELTTNE